MKDKLNKFLNGWSAVTHNPTVRLGAVVTTTLALIIVLQLYVIDVVESTVGKKLDACLPKPSRLVEALSRANEVNLHLVEELTEIQASRVQLTVRATAYTPSPEETDLTPRVTAFNTSVMSGGCAVSRDLEKALTLDPGDTLITTVGDFVVNDRMHRRKRLQIDIFMESKKDAESFGVRYIQILEVRRKHGAFHGMIPQEVK